METDDDLDTHICLSCQLPIIGLDNYVFHKKHECSAKKRKHVHAGNLSQPVSDAFSQVTAAQGDINGADGTALQILQNQRIASLQVTPGQLTPVICQAMNLQLSPVASQAMTLLTKTLTTTVATRGLNSGTAGSYSAVNPNMVLNTVTTPVNDTGHGLGVSETDEVSGISGNLSTTTPSIMGFLSTLELQCRSHPSPGKLGSSATDALDDQNSGLESRVPDGLKLANLLNDLNFDSDSEGFDMPSDAEDFLNFTEEDYHELGAQYVTGSSGGKGKFMGEGKGHGKGKSKGKSEYFHTSGKNKKGSIPGKWRPGERSGGKLASAGRWMSIGKRHYEEMSSDGEQAEQESAPENALAAQEQDAPAVSNNGDGISQQQDNLEVDTKQATVGDSCLPKSSEDVTLDMTSKTMDSMEATAVDVLLKINSNIQEPVQDHTYDGTGAPPQEGQDHTYDTVSSDRGVIAPLKCEPCDRLFKNALALHSHMRSSQHKAVAAGLPIIKPCKNTDKQFHVECGGCQRSFNNKYNYARHLVSALHLKRSRSSLLHLDPAFQRLLLPLKLFQCRICLFYCNTHTDLLNHMSSNGHNGKIDELVGPMTCTRCKFNSRSRREIYEHFTTQDHMKTISNSDRPCLLREVRHNLPCVHCSKVFHSATKLQQHYNTQHPIKQEKCKGVPKQTFCDVCKRNFSTHHNWVQHVRRKHKQNGEDFRCNICNTKNFADQSYLDHHYKSRKHLDNVLKASTVMSKDMKSSITEAERRRGRGRPPLNKAESRKVFKCKECEYSSTVYTDLRPHYIELHSKNIVHDFLCETCGFDFDTQAKLDKHFQSRKHLQTEREAKEVNHQAIICSTCNHKFYTKDRFSLHLLSHKPIGHDLPQGRKGLNKLKGVPEKFHKFVMKLPSGHTKDVQCPECKEWCKCNNIVPHIRGKHGDPNELPYRCNFCPKSFPSSASLYRHHKAHLGMKSFACKICSKAYRSRSDLETHELVIHSSELNIVAKFQCFFCGESFMQRNRLNIHLKKKHEKERAYPCRWPGCHRQFIYRSEYNQHMRVHTGERPFLCDLCGYSTKTKVQLRRHEKSHTGESNYKCKYCTYSASHSWGLRRHMRIHSGVKPYKCPHCDYRCNCHTNLRHHIITSKRHPGRYLYHCKECTFATNRGTEFQQHCIELHSIPPEKVENVAEYCGVYLPQDDTRDVLEGSQILPVPERKPRTQKNSLFVSTERGSASCIQDLLSLDIQDQKTFAPEHQVIGNGISVKTEQTQQEPMEIMPQVHQIVFQQQTGDEEKQGQESQGAFIPQIVTSHEVIANNNDGVIHRELHPLGEHEVTHIPFNADLTHLLAQQEGIEHTAAVVELRMEDDYTFTATRSGQSLQIIGQDNKPVQFYYA